MSRSVHESVADTFQWHLLIRSLDLCACSEACEMREVVQTIVGP